MAILAESSIIHRLYRANRAGIADDREKRKTIMYTLQEESVRGIVIGGDDRIFKYALFYKGRQNSQYFFAETAALAEIAGREELAIMRKESWFYQLYPSRKVEDWEIRIW